MVQQAKYIAELLWAGGLPFAFHLWRKPEQLGPIHVDHFWMDTGSLYGQRRKTAVNLQPVADYFWMQCGLAGTYTLPAMQETYLLARLCPYVRGTAAQRILADARLGRPGNPFAAKRQEAAELEALLAGAQRLRHRDDRQLTMRRFHRKTADMLGMPHFSKAESEAYRDLSEELFTEARQVLVDRGPVGAEIALANWQQMTQRIGRRSGPRVDLKKTAMNMLSYEARAAVHRCYSCVWSDLIRRLLAHYKLSPQTVRFLHLMHLERVSQSTIPEADFHLFHGHVFALHPAMAALMRTATGKALVGQYVEAETAEQQVGPFQKLLAAINVSLCYYVGRHEESRRTQREADAGEGGVDALVDRWVVRRRGRRPRPKRDD